MRNLVIASLLVLLSIFALSSCATSRSYNSVNVGEFDGKLRLQWIGPDRFVYIKDTNDPFRFTRADGEVIEPETFFTDSGSLPRFLRVKKDFSPMNYAPAYIIHDWMFQELTDNAFAGKDFCIEKSALVFGEGVKTLMESDNGIPVKPGLWKILYEGARSPAAEYAVTMQVWYEEFPDPDATQEKGARFYQPEKP